jgi:ABC-2 type transport system ATP-binding protein
MICMIEINHLTKIYKKKSRGILDVSLLIKEGEVFGFIGPNGAGKSTTVRTLLNLIFPTSGSAFVDGYDILQDSIEIRKIVGYIPSEVNYYGDMTVLNFLKYSAQYYGEIEVDRILILARRLDLDLTKKIESLSHGSKKKVAIIQAILHRPKILILDEPTSGLDPLIQSVFFELLEEERKRGVTIFFSSHILSEVQKICDRVGIIREGKLIKIEKIDDILKTQAKNVSITSEEKLELLNSHIVNLKQLGPVYTFTYTGTMTDLIHLLHGKKLIDLTITEPTLEEIFMHYYEKEVN